MKMYKFADLFCGYCKLDDIMEIVYCNGDENENV